MTIPKDIENIHVQLHALKTPGERFIHVSVHVIKRIQDAIVEVGKSLMEEAGKDADGNVKYVDVRAVVKELRKTLEEEREKYRKESEQMWSKLDDKTKDLRMTRHSLHESTIENKIHEEELASERNRVLFLTAKLNDTEDYLQEIHKEDYGTAKRDEKIPTKCTKSSATLYAELQERYNEQCELREECEAKLRKEEAKICELYEELNDEKTVLDITKEENEALGTKLQQQTQELWKAEKEIEELKASNENKEKWALQVLEVERKEFESTITKLREELVDMEALKNIHKNRAEDLQQILVKERSEQDTLRNSLRVEVKENKELRQRVGDLESSITSQGKRITLLREEVDKECGMKTVCERERDRLRERVKEQEEDVRTSTNALHMFKSLYHRKKKEVEELNEVKKHYEDEYVVVSSENVDLRAELEKRQTEAHQYASVFGEVRETLEHFKKELKNITADVQTQEKQVVEIEHFKEENKKLRENTKEENRIWEEIHDEITAEKGVVHRDLDSAREDLQNERVRVAELTESRSALEASNEELRKEVTETETMLIIERERLALCQQETRMLRADNDRQREQNEEWKTIVNCMKAARRRDKRKVRKLLKKVNCIRSAHEDMVAENHKLLKELALKKRQCDMYECAFEQIKEHEHVLLNEIAILNKELQNYANIDNQLGIILEKHKMYMQQHKQDEQKNRMLWHHIELALLRNRQYITENTALNKQVDCLNKQVNELTKKLEDVTTQHDDVARQCDEYEKVYVTQK